MAINSPPRRVAKWLLGKLLSDSAYQRVLARSVLRDLRTGTATEPELALVPHLVREGETAIDLGASLAVWTWPLSRAVGERGRVLAFEPVPYTAGTLSVVISRLGLSNVELIQKGVGASPGEATFLVPFQPSGVTDTGRAHLAKRGDGGAEPGRFVRAEIVRLDDFLDQTSSVSLIKADIEGAELFAFRDAVGLIERDAPTIVCEIDLDLLAGFGLTAGDVMEFFSTRRYEMLRYDETARELNPVTDSASVGRGNYLFVHSSRSARLSDFRPRG